MGMFFFQKADGLVCCGKKLMLRFDSFHQRKMPIEMSSADTNRKSQAALPRWKHDGLALVFVWPGGTRWFGDSCFWIHAG